MVDARVVIHRKRLVSRDGVIVTSIIEEVRYMPYAAARNFEAYFPGAVASIEAVAADPGQYERRGGRRSFRGGRREVEGVEAAARTKRRPAAPERGGIDTASLIGEEVAKLR